MKAGRNGPNISHLMFADDLLLFGQATHNTMNSIMSTLTKFCQMSGQQVNHTKTSIFYSKNVSRPIRDDLNALSGFTEASSLGNYLGVPALGRKPRSNDFYYLIDKVKNRLAGWKAKQLSMAGRITLAKSVIQAIPIYPMMSMQIPRSCLDDIEKIQRSFIWGETENVKRVHTIGWNTMILPKYLGGLGIRNLRIMNDACLMKLGWNLRTKKESLWTQVLWGKYGRDGNATTELVVKHTDSNLWKTIADLWPRLIEHEYWAVGNGSSINFWTDKWLDDNTRIGDLVSVIPEEARGWKVSDVVTNEGEWNFDLISTTTPGEVINKLRSVVPPSHDNELDVQLWPGNRMGVFTVAEAYRRLAGFHMQQEARQWKQVWRIEATERVRVFIWQIMHDKLLTNWRLAKWNLCRPYCSYCGRLEETTLHVLRDCPLANIIWQHLVDFQHRGRFFLASFDQWIAMNIYNDIGQATNVKWITVWATCCFWIWKWRNYRVHETNFKEIWQPWCFILNQVHSYKITQQRYFHMEELTKTEIHISWKPPQCDWILLNTDGAAKKETGMTGCGGLLRDSNGRWVVGFAKNLGNTNAYMAELWGLYEGLILANNMGVHQLEVQLDSSIVVDSIQHGRIGSAKAWSIIKRIKQLLDLNW
ncbi:RNA-directed DNA polymerase (Reverse transcriptase), partial [Trifolium medium]|nr:RNA-directed DNA polymerase (Reverse transcriptase) [Trifolium medium]